jgi:hypothetical protein
MKLMNRVLPAAVGVEGDALKSGAEAREETRLPDWLTSFGDKAIARHNEA